MNKIIVFGILGLLCMGIVSSYNYYYVEDSIVKYNVNSREDCLDIEEDKAYNTCITFHNQFPLKLGDPLIGYRK